MKAFGFPMNQNAPQRCAARGEEVNRVAITLGREESAKLISYFNKKLRPEIDI